MRLNGILIALAAALAAPATAQTMEQAAKIDALFASIKPEDPGCAVGVTQDGATVIEKAYGLANLEHGVPNTTATLFEIGSVSKQFTAAAVLLLERDGKLKLSDDIRKHLPEMPDYGQPVTIEMLLDHTSGLRDWGSLAFAAGKWRGERNFTNAETLDMAARQTALNYTPGEAYSYTNTGFNLAAIIVERVSGKSFMDFTRERLFEPLGMTSAQWRDDFNRVVKNRATAYAPTADGYVQAMPFMNVYGNGGLMMTISDLTRWNEAMMADTLGLRAGMEKQGVLTSGRTILYGRGVNVGEHNGAKHVFHSGVTGGYMAWLSRFPEARLSIAALCNRPLPRAANPEALIEVFLGALPTTEAATGLSDPAGYVGQFVDMRTGMPLEVTSEDGQLRLGGRRVVRVSETKWVAGNDSFTFTSPDRIEIATYDGNLHTYARMRDEPLPAARFGDYAGVYRSDETLGTYRVTLEGDKLWMTLDGWPEWKLVLTPSYRDAFLDEDVLVRFRRGKDGKVAEMSLGESRMWDLRVKRVK